MRRGPGSTRGWRLVSPPAVALLACALIVSRRRVRRATVELTRLSSELDAARRQIPTPTARRDEPVVVATATVPAGDGVDLATEWEAAAAPMDS